MNEPKRKIEIRLNPDFDNQETPYSYVVLEWSNGPCMWHGPNSDQIEEIVKPGTENGCWFNTGVCGWEATPEVAFTKALERAKERGLTS